MGDDRNIEVDGLKIRKCVRKGSIKYSDIPALASVDLEDYRSTPTEYYSFKY